MSETSDIKGTDTPGQQGVPGQPSDAELASMSRFSSGLSCRSENFGMFCGPVSMAV